MSDCSRNAFKPKEKPIRTISIPPLEMFPTGVTVKEQALKVHEESAEMVEAVKSGDEDAALYEFMDTLQAMANLCYLKNWSALDLVKAYDRVKASNRARGRYGEVD